MVVTASDPGCGHLTEALEHPINHFVGQLATLCITFGPDPLNKVLVAEALVEGDKIDTPLLHQLIETRLQGLAIRLVLRQPGGVENSQCLVDGVVGLAGARWAKQNLVEGG
ncbi:hypothetical protein D3C77_317460 [compost metagenome]